MSIESTTSPRSAFSVLGDIVIAPQAAFAAIAAWPRWVEAYVVTAVLGMIGAYLQIPGGVHVATVAIAKQAATDPNMASMSPAKLAQMTALVTGIQHWFWLAYPVLLIVFLSIAAGFLLLGTMIAGKGSSFSRMFSLAANVGLIYYGLAYLVHSALMAVHPASDFSSSSDVVRVMPSLAWLVPNASPKLTAFLGAFNPFLIWSAVLLSLGLQRIAGLGPVPAYIIGAIVGFGNVATTVLAAK